MARNKNIRWIVRSGGKILGPYYEREISEMLRNRQLVLLDEISRPSGRWIFIRDEPLYARVVEELRLSNLRGLKDNSDTEDLTETATPIFEDDLTQDIQSPTSQKYSSVQDIMFQSVDDMNVMRPQASNYESYTHKKDAGVRLQSEVTAKWVWAVSIILILATAGFVLFSRFVSKPILQKQIVDQNTLDGIDALEEGEFEKALDLFEGAHRMDPRDRSLYLYLGMLRIQVAEQPVAGMKLLNEIRNKEGVDLRKVFTGIGIANLYDRNYSDADMNFKKALEIDPLFHFATVNLGAMAFEKGEFAEANNHLLLATKEGSEDGAEHLLLTRVAEKIYEQNKDTKQILEVIKNLRKFGERNVNYRLEVAIAMTYLETLIEQKFDIEKRINSILDLDPYLTELHKNNLFIFRKSVRWSVINQWCLKMTDKFDPMPRVIALEALCLIKAGDYAEANRKIDTAVNQRPADPLVQSVNSFVLRNMKSPIKAVVAAEKAIANDPDKSFAQPRRILAQLCLEAKKEDCAMNMWKEVLNIDSNSIDAIAGIAADHAKNRNYVDMRDWVERGKKISLNYRPLLPLMRQLTRANDKSQGRGL